MSRQVLSLTVVGLLTAVTLLAGCSQDAEPAEPPTTQEATTEAAESADADAEPEPEPEGEPDTASEGEAPAGDGSWVYAETDGAPTAVTTVGAHR